jgi:glyoxylase-like metal-dependent hydrolase (beta-lactamase superfamily II)
VACDVFQVEVGMLLNFNAFFFDKESAEAAIVDPAYEVDRLLRLARERGLRIGTVLVTHTHHDHIDGVPELCAATGAVVRVGAGEAEALAQHAPAARIEPIADEERVRIGNEELVALSTPGHTVAGMSYYSGEAVATGDALFVGGCGRTDFPGGDPATLHHSLQRLAALPEETRVFPGHDYGQTPTSTIGWERTTNPYMRCRSVEEFIAMRTGKNPPRPTRGPR